VAVFTCYDPIMPPRPPAIGERFAERFELQELLIHGPLGPAFRAWDSDVDETVALLILDDAAKAAGGEEQLRHQVRVARRITHRNIARTYDIGEHQGRHFVSMEYIHGLRLREWLAGEPSHAEIIEVTAQLADGLAAAHAVGVIHCNVAPISVMIDERGRAVLGNFGVSRFEAAETLAQITNRVDEMLRSAAYLAPEQVRGEPATAAVDVYALGLVLFEMLTGAARFRGEQPVAVANARLDDDLHDLLDPAARDPAISPTLAPVLAACLARAPGERIPAAELATELRALLRDATPREAPGEPRHDSLAVLPFRYRGPAESSYLTEALHDELVDLLAQTRGLRVAGTGASAKLTGASDRDPRQIGRELGVEVIVDGTILLAGERLRISARLVEVSDAFVLWHERFEGSVADVFELQDKLAKRIAEALRLELEIIAHRGSVDTTAIESYLRGRHAHLRWHMFGPDGAIAHYRAALERAPGFEPALAHLAVAMILAWFQPHAGAEPDWGGQAAQAVERAMELAPELPETRLAAGSLAAQRGEFHDAALHLDAALSIAPTFALAHEFLGRMLLESGRRDRGIEHLELAVELDPTLSYCLADIARHHALHGDFEGFRAQLERLMAIVDHHRPATGMLLMRVGAWTRDPAMIREGIELLGEDRIRSQSLHRYGYVLLEGVDELAPEYDYAREVTSATSPRLLTLIEQLTAEQAAYFGDLERALKHVRAAAELVLIDLEWLDHCPLLSPLRGRPEFAEARALVLHRSERIWAVVSRGRSGVAQP
jgi:TolB-like protein